jgi:hypothetical protein
VADLTAGKREAKRIELKVPWPWTKASVELLARRAQLDKALAEFPKDVAAAAKQTSEAVAKMKLQSEPRDEPWPPMRVGSGL